MTYDYVADRRLDPRIVALLTNLPSWGTASNVTNREEILAEANSPEGRAAQALTKEFMEMADNEEIAPSAGLRVENHTVTSDPDGNVINIRFIRPDNDEVIPCVYYIHGGGMTDLSCYYGNYRAWGKIMAAKGVAVAMVDFRNAIFPSSVSEVAPYPAGLNDCVSGLRWVSTNAGELRVDSSRIVVAGESGGGNLTLATGMQLLREGEINLVTGLYALAPFIAGSWPRPEYPSSTENNGIFIDLHNNRGAMAYGIEAFNDRDPLAWPGFATAQDVIGLPRVVINVNEFDPLRDEGIEFYRLLIANDVPARCRLMMGTIHATEVFPVMCPDVTHDTARDIVAFASEHRNR